MSEKWLWSGRAAPGGAGAFTTSSTFDRKDREVSVIVAAVKASQPVGHRSAKRAGAWPEDFGVVRLESSALILGEEPML